MSFLNNSVILYIFIAYYHHLFERNAAALKLLEIYNLSKEKENEAGNLRGQNPTFVTSVKLKAIGHTSDHFTQ